MKEKWKQVLQPFAQAYCGALLIPDDYVREDLEELLAACEMPTESNCWWATYQVAKLLKPEIKHRLRLFDEKGPNDA